MVSAGSYVLSAVLLAALILSLGLSAVLLRRRLLPEWEGAPAHLVESVVGVALVIWLAELLGLFGLLYAGSLVGGSLLTVGVIAVATERGRESGFPHRLRRPVFRTDHSASGAAREAKNPAAGEGTPTPFSGPMLVALGVIALVFAHWGLTTADALNRGIFNFDSLWYHMPFAVEMAQSHSVTGLHYTETVFTNWFYPQNSELLHGVGILLTERDTLSLFLNFGWLAMAFLAAWCIGRPYGRGPLTVVAAAVLLECHTLVVREPGAAKNDLMAAALLLAAIAVLINAHVTRGGRGTGRPAWVRRPVFRTDHSAGDVDSTAKNPPRRGAPSPTPGPASQMLPLAVAGLATGLAVGTKSTALAMAAALTVAVVVLAPIGRRWAAAAWWFGAALAGGGFWYLRNLIVAGNPLPQLESLGPISLPHPERLQSGRPDFSIAHYATDTGVWRDYFGPGLDQAFGALWPLVVAGALAGGMVALLWGRERALRWMGGVALFGLLAYVFTPLSAAGAEGEPVGFGINIRYAIPALLAGVVLLPLAPVLAAKRNRALKADVPAVNHPYGGLSAGTSGLGWWGRARRWLPLVVLLLILVATNRADAVLRDPDRLFAWLVALLFVLVPAGLLLWRNRAERAHRVAGRPTRARAVVVAGCTMLALAVVAIGYPLQRDYLEDRFANADPDTAIPGMRLDSAYRWARGVEDARIGLAGTTAGFLQYGFYGTDLSNRVRYIGVEGQHGAFNAIPTCRGFRAAVNAAELDYLVTAPFLNFIETDQPIRSPEAGWLRGERVLTPVQRSGQVTVWRVRGRLDAAACGPRNAPLRYVPQQPG